MTMDDKLMISSFFWHLGGFGQLVKDLRKILKIIESFNWSWFINNVSCNRIENKDLKKIGWVWWEPGSYLGTGDLSKPGGNDGDDDYDHGGGNYNKKALGLAALHQHRNVIQTWKRLATPRRMHNCFSGANFMVTMVIITAVMVIIMVVMVIIMVSMRMVMVNAWSWHLWPPMHCNGVTVSVQSWCYGDAPGHWAALKVHLIDCQGRHQVLKDDFLESCLAAQSIWFFSFGLEIKSNVRSFV